MIVCGQQSYGRHCPQCPPVEQDDDSLQHLQGEISEGHHWHQHRHSALHSLRLANQFSEAERPLWDERRSGEGSLLTVCDCEGVEYIGQHRRHLHNIIPQLLSVWGPVPPSQCQLSGGERMWPARSWLEATSVQRLALLGFSWAHDNIPYKHWIQSVSTILFYTWRQVSRQSAKF